MVPLGGYGQMGAASGGLGQMQMDGFGAMRYGLTPQEQERQRMQMARQYDQPNMAQGMTPGNTGSGTGGGAPQNMQQGIGGPQPLAAAARSQSMGMTRPNVPVSGMSDATPPRPGMGGPAASLVAQNSPGVSTQVGSPGNQHTLVQGSGNVPTPSFQQAIAQNGSQAVVNPSGPPHLGDMGMLTPMEKFRQQMQAWGQQGQGLGDSLRQSIMGGQGMGPMLDWMRGMPAMQRPGTAGGLGMPGAPGPGYPQAPQTAQQPLPYTGGNPGMGQGGPMGGSPMLGPMQAANGIGAMIQQMGRGIAAGQNIQMPPRPQPTPYQFGPNPPGQLPNNNMPTMGPSAGRPTGLPQPPMPPLFQAPPGTPGVPPKDYAVNVGGNQGQNVQTNSVSASNQGGQQSVKSGNVSVNQGMNGQNMINIGGRVFQVRMGPNGQAQLVDPYSGAQVMS